MSIPARCGGSLCCAFMPRDDTAEIVMRSFPIHRAEENGARKLYAITSCSLRRAAGRMEFYA